MNNKMNSKYGRRIVITCFLIMAVIYAPGINLAGLYVTPIANTFNITRTASALTGTISTVASIIGSMFAGQLLKRFSMRKVMSVLLIVSAVSYIGMSFSNSIFIIYIFTALRGTTNTILTVVPIAMIISNWYGPTTRGKSLGIAMAGSGFGAMLLNPITGFIIESLGWRQGYQFFGLLTLLMIPPVLFSFIDSPKEKGLQAVGEEDSDLVVSSKLNKEGISAKDALKKPTFWLLFLAFVLIAGATQSFNINGASFLGDIGFNPGIAATILSVMSFGLIVGKLFLGAICDRYGTKLGSAISILTLILAYILFTFAPSLGYLAIIGAPMIGFGMATNTIIQPLTASEFFGFKDYGVLVGYFQVASSVGSSIVPLLISSIYDNTKSYTSGWILLAITLTFAVGLVLYAYRIKSNSKKESSI